MKRTASQFSRNEVQQIALKYVNTDNRFTATYFCKVYGFAEHVFYALLARAIVESIVSEEAAWRIAAKSKRNSDFKVSKAVRRRSVKRYEELMERRKRYDFSKKQKEYYASEYAYTERSVTTRSFAQMHVMSPKMLKGILVSAIVDDIVSDEIVEKLYEKALQHNDVITTRRCFMHWKALREKNRKDKKKHNEKLRKAREEKKKYAEVFGEFGLPDDFISPIFSDGPMTLEEVSEMEQKLQQYDYIQMTIAEYGITDEEREYLESLDDVRRLKEIVTTKRVDGADNLNDDSEQLSFQLEE